MVRATQTGHQPEHEEEQICPLCINELDDTERAWLPCSCGYQLCLFCYDRLRTEFGNRCPNCRVEYDSDFQAGLRRRQERVAQLQQEREAAAKVAATAAVGERAGGKQGQPPPPPPPPRTPRSPRSPKRDLRIEQERLWPSLGPVAQAQPQHAPHGSQKSQAHAVHRQQSPHSQPLEAASQRHESPPQLAAILPRSPPGYPAAEQEASSSGSADTAATTPQSPVSSVVAFRAASTMHHHPDPLKSPPVMLAVGAPLQGRCSVVLRGNGGLGAEADPEGASLAASLTEAVRTGSLSVKQAAASLASYLRQRQAHCTAAGSAGSSPARAPRQPSSAGSPAAARGVMPFSLALGGLPSRVDSSAGGLLGEHSLAPCNSGMSAATSASLSHWASSVSPASMAPPPLQPGLFGGTWQQQQQEQQQQPVAASAGSPVRENDRLPLFMRRGSLAASSAADPALQPSVGSPGSKGSSGSSAASFPGFPSGASSPTTQELKRLMAPPPGFGPTPLGAAGIAALPRFR